MAFVPVAADQTKERIMPGEERQILPLFIGCIGLVPLVCCAWALLKRKSSGAWPSWLVQQSERTRGICSRVGLALAPSRALGVSIVLLILGAVVGAIVVLSVALFYLRSA